MIKIKDVVMDTGGNGVHNVTVTITQYPSGAAATLYSDNGVTPLLGNSVLTDELGQYEFYIPNGRYTRTVSKTGATTVVDLDIIQANDGSGISVSNGKTFTVLNSLTLAGTDGTTITLPSSSSALAGIAGAQTFTGLQTFANGITSAGATTVNDTLTVTGPTSLTTLSTSSNASVGGTLGVTGASTLSSLTVTGATSLNSLSLSGAFSPTQISTGSVTSSSLSAFNAGLTATTVETTGVATLATATITGNSTVGGTLGVTGMATFNNITVSADVIVNDDLTVASDTILNTLTTSGATSLGSTLGVVGAATVGSLVCSGAASFAGKGLSLGGSFTTVGNFASTFTMTGTTTLTFPTTGTVLSTGNFAMSHIPQTGAASGNVITWNGSAWAPAAPTGGGGGPGSFTTLDASGATTLATTLGVTGATTLNSTLGVTGAATLNSTLGVTGATTLSSTLTATGETRVGTGAADTKLFVGDTTARNAFVMYGRGSGSSPRIVSEGFDTNIGLQMSSKGTSAIDFWTRNFGSQSRHFSISDTFQAVNYLNVTGNATTLAPIMSALGSDTNIDIRVTPKGTGMLSTTGIKIDEGTNKRMGLAVLVAGTVTVSTTAVTANSRIFLTSNVSGGTPGWCRVSARTAGTSFTILSSSGTDTSSIAWHIMEPA